MKTTKNFFWLCLLLVAGYMTYSKMHAASDGQATSTTTSSSTDTTRLAGMEIPVYESSRGGQVLKRKAYTVSYDADYKTPQWVGWILTAAHTSGEVPRETQFYADPDVRGAKAYTKDYTGSGYDRGHMAPAGDMKWDEEAMRQSFYLTNVCPQNPSLNRGDWNDLEQMTRSWAKTYGAVAVVAGPIYYNQKPVRIGANKVAVPHAFFKVLLVGSGNALRAYGFIFPTVSGHRDIRKYQYSVDEVEKVTGMDFFSRLPDEVENSIEAAVPALP
jgi:endonuclease G